MEKRSKNNFFLLLFLQAFFCFAQNGNYTAFTVKDGLPSNYIYLIVEDDRGFLWVATDAGLARFDGKNFQVYTTKNGLPDNEVIAVLKEKDGRIWAECFAHMPVYFDEVQNRFLRPQINDSILKNISNSMGLGIRILKNGGISYGNRDNWIVFKDAKQKEYPSVLQKFPANPIILEEYEDGSLLVAGSSVSWKSTDEKVTYSLFYIKENHIADSLILMTEPRTQAGLMVNDGKLYKLGRKTNECVVYSDFQINPIRYKTAELKVPEFYLNYFFTPKYLCFYGESGKMYLYDHKALQLVKVVSGNYLGNAFYDDSKGNEWISTIDKGLLVYRSRLPEKILLPENFTHTNFMSIARRSDGTLLAGNYYGEVLEIKNGKTIIHKVIDHSPARIRKILFSGNDVYTFSEEGIYRNFTQRISDPLNEGLSFAKTAINANDTIILVGTHRNMFSINTRTHKTFPINTEIKRITALEKTNADWVYFGSTDGLYKYNMKSGKMVSLTARNPLLKNRILSLCYTEDGLLWVGISGRLFVLKNDEIIRVFEDKTFAYNSIRHITKGKPGEVWIATSGGINVLNYTLNGKNISHTVRTISANDGLTSDDVQELFYQNGKIYAATANGISVIPEDYTTPKTDIPTYLVHIRINGKEAEIQDKYQLDYGQQDIQMQFAGVDLNGYFKHLQYALDNSGWINLNENTLNLQLSTGTHKLKVRSVDINGKISSKILNIAFDIEVPFWQKIWFWIACGILIQILLYFLISHYLKRKREQMLAQKIAGVQTAALEQQAFTSLMNPHFMFNALNSIQHYINVQDRKNANRYLSDFASLIRKNFDAAQQSFIPLEEEIENIKIYLNLEQMRFNDKFDYSIEIDEDLDPEDWMIPTMVLQPLLENALLHGIMPSAVHGEITVRFQPQEQDLLIVITDNGIGMANSIALKGKDTHKSRGMELIKKRIKALTNFGTKPMSIIIETASEHIQNPGTKIILFIPFTLYGDWYNAQKDK